MLPGGSAVTYDGLPLASGGAHSLGRISPVKALAGWRTFTVTCARVDHLRGYFSAPTNPGLEPGDGVLDKVAHHFAPDREAPDRFVVPANRVDDAVRLYESFGQQPTNDYGIAALWLTLVADLTMLQPETGTPWPGQDPQRFGSFVTPGGIRLGSSSAKLILRGKASLGLSLSFPEATDEDVETVVPWLQAALPMRLSSKHWARWTRTTGGNSYRSRRLAPSRPG